MAVFDLVYINVFQIGTTFSKWCLYSLIITSIVKLTMLNCKC